MRAIAFPIPTTPRYTTDIYATADASRRYIAVYIIVLIPHTMPRLKPNARGLSFTYLTFSAYVIVYRHKDNADVCSIEKAFYQTEKKSTEGKPFKSREDHFKKSRHAVESFRHNQPVEKTENI
jgi:hypothetical protein